MVRSAVSMVATAVIFPAVMARLVAKTPAQQLLELPVTVVGEANHRQALRSLHGSDWWSTYGSGSSGDHVWEEGSPLEFSDGEGFTYVGCFKEDGSEQALLDYGFQSGGMTTQLCFDVCSVLDSAYMALMYGSQCWCGGAGEEAYTKNGEGTCNMACSGDPDSTCGGYYTFDLYSLSGSSSGSSSGRVSTSSSVSTSTSGSTSGSGSTGGSVSTSGGTAGSSTSGSGSTGGSTSGSSGTGTTPSVTPAPSSTSPTGQTPAPVDIPAPTPEGGGNCDVNPCLNGGSCAQDPSGGFMCSCASGFGGITCQHDTAGLASFYIELDFIGTWTEDRKNVFLNAGKRWAEVISHVPCGGTANNPAGQLLISAELTSIDGVSGVLGSAGPSGIWDECQGISYTGAMEFDSADIDAMEEEGTLAGVILHEMGHVIGVGTLWDECSTCRQNSSPEWTCPAAAQAYNDLVGAPAGSPANIVELEGSEGTACGHFAEDMFDDELMTGYVNFGTMPISKITVASLEDIGYVVNPGMVDEYEIPEQRPPSARSDDSRTPFEFVEGLAFPIEVTHEVTGDLVTIREGVRFRF